jgi:hypothetical protein
MHTCIWYTSQFTFTHLTKFNTWSPSCAWRPHCQLDRRRVLCVAFCNDFSWYSMMCSQRAKCSSAVNWLAHIKCVEHIVYIVWLLIDTSCGGGWVLFSVHYFLCKRIFTSVQLSVSTPFHVLEVRTCCKWNEEWCVVVHVTKTLNRV